ncbi:MAG TPA: hypothetical protein VM580_18600, partial [Labilithrix sp.]|nr:hypothetical protein [Labilithrix sp.]
FIKIKPDVEIKTDVGADGKGHKLTLISRDVLLLRLRMALMTYVVDRKQCTECEGHDNARVSNHDR